MKKVTLSSVLVFFAILATNAQFGNILDRAKQKTKDKVNQKVDQKMDKAIGGAIDSVDNTISGKKTKSGSNNEKKETNNTGDGNESKGNTPDNSVKAAPESLKSYSKFDFVPGAKIIAAEDFSQDAVGDFPAKWNTNGSGEIITTNIAPGRYLETKKEVTMYPEWIKELPENFTLEFDLLASDNFNFYSSHFVVGFTTEKSISKDWRSYGRFGQGGTNSHLIQVSFHPTNAGMQQGYTTFTVFNNGNRGLFNEADQGLFTTKNSRTKVHISIWRQGQRIRVYMNEKKVWDIPRALEEKLALNTVFFRNDGASNENDAFYFGNIKLAVGAPDTRNKLITEGKFVTHGILFDVNSDKIKPESYGTLKEIAGVLTENSNVKVKIIGHTDTDGDDGSNLALSKKRAEAVKNTLTKEFAIDALRITTDGKGESQPVETNTTPAGKASNRRVEFIKE